MHAKKVRRRLAQDFAGARRVSAVNYSMPKRAVLIVLGLLGLSLPLAAQPTSPREQTGDGTAEPEISSCCALETGSTLNLYPSDVFSTADSAALVHDLPLRTVWEGPELPVSSALGRMGTMPADLFPLAYLSPVKARKVNDSPTSGKDAKDSPDQPVDVSRPSRYYVGGEVGLSYGRFLGKVSGDDFQQYIVGTVGNDKFQITASVSHDELNVRVPRFGH
jgi:hypothetical protein